MRNHIFIEKNTKDDDKVTVKERASLIKENE